MKFLKLLLVPFSYLYGIPVFIRNLFFDKNIFRTQKVDAAIISVGNITAGGSGKTPLVIYLLELLKKHNLEPAVLSRGYGRSTSGYLLVSKNGEIEKNVTECGDEIYQTVLECKVPAAVSEKRVPGAKRLIKDTGVKTIVLDDAYQHRWIYRDIDLLIFEQRFLLYAELPDKFLLPAGFMRESLNGVKRADAIIINRKFSPLQDIPTEFLNYMEGKKIFTAYYKSICFVDLTTKAEHTIEEFSGQKSLVVAGIANPFSFFNVLKQTNVDTENRIVFKDHKHYSHKEVQEIRQKFYATNSHSVVTTEKDAVKLLRYATELDDVDIFFLKIKLVPDDPQAFDDFIISGLKNRIKKD